MIELVLQLQGTTSMAPLDGEERAHLPGISLSAADGARLSIDDGARDAWIRRLRSECPHPLMLATPVSSTFVLVFNRLQLIQGSSSSSSPRTMGVLESFALVVQLTGLDAIMLITLAAGLLRILRCNAECAKLVESARELRELLLLLQRPAPTGLNLATLLWAMPAETLAKAVGLDMATQLRAMALAPEKLAGAAFGLDVVKQLLATAYETLVEAEGLVGSFRRSTFWCRVQTSTIMEAQLRGMQDQVNSLCVIVRCVGANLLTVTVHPASDTTNAT